jgi:hypothetical protein
MLVSFHPQMLPVFDLGMYPKELGCYQVRKSLRLQRHNMQEFRLELRHLLGAFRLLLRLKFR